MKWKQFNTDTIKTPFEVVEEFTEGFEKATNGLVQLTIFEKSEVERLRKKYNANFQYDLILHSQFMRNYKFDVFELLFDVTLYPCAIVLEKGLANELGVTSTDTIILDNVEILKGILESIFNSKRFEDIVSGLMKISSFSKKKDDDLPF